eukprot:TRINITY_DN10159_c0_g1_i1.p1 TRINITY_DN10159_c0_g1~~TRINITY_DN10159_c0_g1_i1.p1  ORF type:complete len:108 (+),score=15.74 TRINITY_DN10159_c0_g1_i1:645-968(+)
MSFFCYGMDAVSCMFFACGLGTCVVPLGVALTVLMEKDATEMQMVALKDKTSPYPSPRQPELKAPSIPLPPARGNSVGSSSAARSYVERTSSAPPLGALRSQKIHST